MIIDKNNQENKILVDLIQPRNKNILEIGCGNGNIAKFLAPLCTQYIGIDVDKNSIDKAIVTNKTCLNSTFFLKSGDETGLKSNSIDTVLMHFCLHEVPPQKQGLVLKEVHRVLKDKGQLLIVDPTEPPGPVQSLFNIGYKICFFDHSTVVKHSINAISEAISHKIFEVKQAIRLNIDYVFTDPEEIYKFIIDDFPEIDWNQTNKRVLKEEVNKIIGTQTSNVTLIDDMTITNLTKI